MSEEKIYTFNNYVIGYDSGLKDRSCLTLSKMENNKMNVLTSIYDENANLISEILDSLLQENQELREQLKQRDKVIENAIKYITSEEYFELNNYMSISESQNRANYFKAHDKLLEILTKYKGDNNE